MSNVKLHVPMGEQKQARQRDAEVLLPVAGTILARGHPGAHIPLRSRGWRALGLAGKKTKSTNLGISSASYQGKNEICKAHPPLFSPESSYFPDGNQLATFSAVGCCILDPVPQKVAR